MRMNNFVIDDGGQVFCNARFGKQLKQPLFFNLQGSDSDRYAYILFGCRDLNQKNIVRATTQRTSSELQNGFCLGKQIFFILFILTGNSHGFLFFLLQTHAGYVAMPKLLALVIKPGPQKS